jgi:hypothetical protein
MRNLVAGVARNSAWLVAGLALVGLAVAVIILFLGPIALPLDLKDRSSISGALGGLFALLAAIIAITAGLWLNSSDFKAEQAVKADTARLRASLRMILIKGAGLTTRVDPIKPRGEFKKELEVISNFANSTTGFGFQSLVERRSKEAGDGPEDWRLFFFNIAQLLDAGDSADRATEVFQSAAWLDEVLSTLTTRDIDSISRYVANLTNALGTFRASGQSDDVLLKGMASVYGKGSRPDPQTTKWKLEHLKKKGVVDPNVDLFIGVFNDDTAAVQAALGAGADVSVTDSKILAAHQSDLADFNPKDWQ